MPSDEPSRAEQTLRRERYIPFRKTDLIDLCARDERLDRRDREPFRAFCRILASVIHFEHHEELERLKDAFAPFNVDADTRTVRSYGAAERAEAQRNLIATLRRVLESANYEEIPPAAVEHALSQDTLLKIRLRIDFDDFDELLLFRRGPRASVETMRSLFGLHKREIEFVSYDRVLIYVKFKGADHFSSDNLRFEPGSTIIKLFQNVPKADLEMLFPNTEIRMRTIDKLIIGVPALVSGIVVVATKLVASLGLILVLIGFWLGLREEPVEVDEASLVALGASLGAVAGYLARQFSKFKNRKIRFMKMLSDNLYFKNLDNDVGVFHHLLDAAEEEECKEALLGYFFLLTTGRPVAPRELDDAVEDWFEARLGCRLDFDISDALGDLTRLGLVEERADGRYDARTLLEAKHQLDATWDAYFDFEPSRVR